MGSRWALRRSCSAAWPRWRSRRPRLWCCPAMPSRSRRSRQGENPLEPIDPEPLTTRKLVERRELRSAADRGFDTLIVPVQEHFLLLARRSDTVPGEKPGPGGAATDAELTYAKRVSELPKSVASNTLTKATGTRPYSGGRPPARSPTSRVGPAETCCSCAGRPCSRPCPIAGWSTGTCSTSTRSPSARDPPVPGHPEADRVETRAFASFPSGGQPSRLRAAV